MTPAGWNGRQPARRPRAALTARQVLWASVPVWSIGFGSFVPFLMYAISRPGRRNWAVFAGYLAATVVMCVALGAAGSNSAATAAVGGYIIALAGCAAVHAAVLFRPGRGPDDGGMPGGPQARARGSATRPPWPRPGTGSSAGRTHGTWWPPTPPWPGT